MHREWQQSTVIHDEWDTCWSEFCRFQPELKSELGTLFRQPTDLVSLLPSNRDRSTSILQTLGRFSSSNSVLARFYKAQQANTIPAHLTIPDGYRPIVLPRISALYRTPHVLSSSPNLPMFFFKKETGGVCTRLIYWKLKSLQTNKHKKKENLPMLCFFIALRPFTSWWSRFLRHAVSFRSARRG